MADEPVVEEAAVAPEVATETVQEPVHPDVHPLVEGGARFNEVYARMKQAEERAARFEGMVQQAQRQQSPPQQQFTSEQAADYLQQQVDRGAVTPMQAANTLSQFNAQRIANQTAVQVQQISAMQSKLQAASAEVMQYLDKVPALRQNTSPEFQRVSEAAYRIGDDMGLPVTDLRVQRVALREVYGSLEKIASAGAARASTREASLPHVESGVTGGRSVSKPAADDGLKDVPAAYLAYWEKRGYSKEQMKEEAKYVTKEPRTHAAHKH